MSCIGFSVTDILKVLRQAHRCATAKVSPYITTSQVQIWLYHVCKKRYSVVYLGAVHKVRHAIFGQF